MTGSILCCCRVCGKEFWVTWGNGGPKEFLAMEDEKRYCHVCRKNVVQSELEASLGQVEKKQPEQDQEDGKSPDEKKDKTGTENLSGPWEGVPGC